MRCQAPLPDLQNRMNTLLSSLSKRAQVALAPLSFESVDRHVVAAAIMIMIAVFGAVAAYRAGLAEQRSIALERRLAHAQLQDISLRQEYLDEVLVGIGIADLRTTLLNEAEELRRVYNALATGDGAAATWLDWHATELLAQRHTHHLFAADLDTLPSSKATSVEQDLATHSAAELRQQGYNTVVSEDRNVQIALSFPLLDQAIAKAHEAVPDLAFYVLLYIVGLVCLTAAELELGPRFLWGFLVGAGSLIALVATFEVLRIDPPTAIALAPLSAAFSCLVFFAARAGLFAHARRPGHAAHPEAPEPTRAPFLHLSGHRAHDPWSKLVVGMIALAVFMSALFGWRYSESLKHMGEFALGAQQKRVELVNQRARLHGAVLGGKFNSAMQLLTARIGCTFATQLSLLVADGKLAMDQGSAGLVARERERRCEGLKKRSKDSWLLDEMDKDNLVDSSLFPARRLRNETMVRADGPENRFGLADGFSEISAAWGIRAAQLLAVLTVLAIVLYLFGQAYAMGDTTAGRWLVGSALLLLFVSSAFGFYAWLAPILASDLIPEACGDGHKEQTESHATVEQFAVERAAYKYDEGMAAFNRATTAPESGEQAAFDEKAIAAFECALAHRPNFIPALQKLAETKARMKSPQRGEAYVSLRSKAMLSEVVKTHLRRLRALERSGLSRPHALLDAYSFNAAMLALTKNRPDLLSEAQTVLASMTGTASWWQRFYVEALRPELSSDEGLSQSPGIWLNLGLAELARGEADKLESVERIYDSALGQKAPLPPDLLAGALTDLEILKAYCSTLHAAKGACGPIVAAADRIRARVAVAASRAELPRDSTARVSGFRAAASPSTAVWQARIEGFEPTRDRLAVAWFADERNVQASEPRADLWKVRRVIPALFETYYPGATAKLPAPDARGRTLRVVSYVDQTNACLPAGRYVVELFLNDALKASQRMVVSSDLQVYRSRELDLLWCIPGWWTPYRSKNTGDRWLADMPARGFTLGGERGRDPLGAIMSFYAPPGMPDDERKQYFVRRAVRMLFRMADKTEQLTQEGEDRLIRRTVSIDSLSDEQCSSPKRLGWPGFRVLSRRIDQPSDKNLVHIGIVSPKIRAREACEILKSLRHYY